MFCGENTCCVQRIQNIMLHILNIYNAVNQQHCVSLSVVSDSLGPRGLKLTRLLCPWNFPGKNTGVGCHSLLRDLLNPGIKPMSPALQADSSTSDDKESLLGYAAICNFKFIHFLICKMAVRRVIASQDWSGN